MNIAVNLLQNGSALGALAYPDEVFALTERRVRSRIEGRGVTGCLYHADHYGNGRCETKRFARISGDHLQIVTALDAWQNSARCYMRVLNISA